MQAKKLKMFCTIVIKDNLKIADVTMSELYLHINRPHTLIALVYLPATLTRSGAGIHNPMPSQSSSAISKIASFKTSPMMPTFKTDLDLIKVE